MRKEIQPVSEIIVPNLSWPQVSKEFKILSADELGRLPSPDRLLGPLLPKPGLSLAFGPPKSGKTFFLLDAMLRVAGGLSAYDGTPSRPGPVVWVAAEGSGSLKVRLEAWCLANAEETPREFFIVEEAVNLFQGEGFDLQIALERAGIEPVAVVFDTLSRCSVGGDENHTRDMQKVVEAASGLIRRFKANVTLVHHSGKGSAGSRGSNSLPASADQVFRIAKRDSRISVISELERDAAPFGNLEFDLVSAGDSQALQQRGSESAREALRPEAERKVISFFGELAPGSWAPTQEIICGTGLSKSSLSRCMAGLLRAQTCESRSKKGGGNAKEYRLVSVQSEQVVPPPPPLGGVEGGTTLDAPAQENFK